MNGRERGKRLVEDIYAAYERAAVDRRPNRLRPSELGHECSRYLWIRYRWADEFEAFEGRMHRLFETGHLQEDRLADDLRKVGSRIVSRDPHNPKEQISFEAMNGHCKGFLDSVGQDIPHADNEWCLVEYKTHSSKSFKQLEKDGVAVAKPQHYAQMQLYMKQHNLPEALYFSVNKDTDELYCEFVEFDDHYAESLYRKGEMVIFSPQIPDRISNNPTFFKCKMCSASKTCFKDELPIRTCRSCRFGEPQPDTASGMPTWRCKVHEKWLDLDDQKAGCQWHRYNPHFVRGEEVSATETDTTLTYTYQDGDVEFIDNGPASDQIKKRTA